jgi:hypothetical protein
MIAIDDDSMDQGSKRAKKAQRVEVVTPEKTNKAENCKFEGKLDTTGKGLLHFNSNCWKKMEEDKDKEFVRNYNAAVKLGDPTEKVTMPKGISVKTKVCRTKLQEEETKPKGSNKKKKGTTFGISDADKDE